jgi:Lrp/AsnC family leucine-responsive transcriptional regulator
LDSQSLDAVDWRILEELQANGRITYTELGRRVSLTAPAVADRVRRLEEARVVRGFRADLDPAAIGYPVTAFVRWTASGQDCAHLAEVARGFPEVVECHRITGEASYLLKVVARDVAHLEAVIDRLMPWGSTVTSVALSSPVRHRVLGPPEALEADHRSA